MASSVECDIYGFFNGIMGIEHSNWAKFWQNIVPDGVLLNDGDELKVYAQSDGMKVHISTGSAIVAGHRVWVTSEKEIDIADNDSGSTRIDGIVLRITYGNYGESKVSIVAKQGVISCVKNIGGTYEMLLATVSVSNGASTIAASKVSDRRYTFRLAGDEGMLTTIDLTESSGSYSGTVELTNDRVHRCTTNALKSVRINFPAYPPGTFMAEVDFTSAANFTGISFYQGSSTITPYTIGDELTEVSKRYNILIWRDGSDWWVAAKAVS